MKMKMIAAAVVAGLAAPAVHAAPTVYGSVHLSVDSLDNGNNCSGTTACNYLINLSSGATSTTTGTAGKNLLTLSSNSSYVGIKGDEDLGDGLKAIYGAEWQMGFDNAWAGVGSAGGLANRNVFAGLQGGFGTVRAGNYDDIVKQVGRAVDLFWSEQLGENRALTAGALGANNDDARLANSINYESPKLAGAFTVTVNYGMENTATDNTSTATAKAKATAIGAVYAAGPLYVGLAHKSTTLANTLAAGVLGDSTTVDRLTAAYTMGNIKIAAFYQKDKDLGGFSGADRTVTGIGAAFTMGKGVLKAQYYQAGDIGDLTDTGATLTAIGYDYNLSANTAIYATYAAISNKAGGAYSVIGAGHSNPNDATTGMPGMTVSSNVLTLGGFDADPSGISVGMKVKF